MTNKININKLDKEELKKLKIDIDLQLAEIERREQEENLNSISSFTKLSEMKRGGKILCIHFHQGKVYEVDFVEIKFSKSKEGHGYRFSTSHKFKPLGCSSWLSEEEIEEHCFLSDFSLSDRSNFYFYTLKPETWEEDLRILCGKHLHERRVTYEKELEILKNRLNELFDSSKQIEDFVKNLSQA
jgi:hypothetical protein